MAETVRIDSEAYASLSEISKEMHVSLTCALSQAIELCRRELFLKGLANDFASLRADERDEEKAECEAWDTTNADGLADE
jgi:predicted transcriptional regulator